MYFTIYQFNYTIKLHLLFVATYEALLAYTSWEYQEVSVDTDAQRREVLTLP